MKPLSEKTALGSLTRLKQNLRDDVAVYEERAKSCSACDTPGACCLDEHFVNVRISRLEAIAIANAVEALPTIRRLATEERIRNAFAEIVASEGDTFACPLYEQGTGCLVHCVAKPVPCIIHSCYDRQEDLPPDELQDAAEIAIDQLNARVYGRTLPFEPIPTAVQAILRTRRSHDITSPARNHPAT